MRRVAGAVPLRVFSACASDVRGHLPRMLQDEDPQVSDQVKEDLKWIEDLNWENWELDFERPFGVAFIVDASCAG